MENFSLGTVIIGIGILIAGVFMTMYHQKLADNLGSGVSSYDRFKLAGLIACGIGFLVMTNIHAILLTALVELIFPRI